MDVTFKTNKLSNRYEIFADGVLAGFEDYTLGESEISLEHTEILPAFVKVGLAPQLVTHALEDARAKGLSVLPLCSYVAKYIRQRPHEYVDLVPEYERRRFNLQS
jgi:uncharacterized protein